MCTYCSSVTVMKTMNENYVISKLKFNLDRKEKNKFLKVIAVDSTKFIFVPITNGL